MDLAGGAVVAAAVGGYGRNWWRSLAELDGADTRRVAKAVDRFIDDPDHPGLNLHPVESDATGRLHTFRASRDLRVLLVREGSLYWLLEAGHHDAVYQRAERQRFVVSEPAQIVGLLDRDVERQAPATPDAVASAPEAVAQGPGIFDHWADADLREVGLPDDLIRALRGCATEDDLCLVTTDDATFDTLVELLEKTPEQRREQTLMPVRSAEDRIRDAIVSGAVLTGISGLFPPEEVARLAAAPIEEWMVFLHPDQRSLVERRYGGPARVRGSAGTGKTVVALHRAAVLARRLRDDPGQEPLPGKPILFTTYIRSLPPVFAGLYQRLPGADIADVEFVNIDKLAFAVCAAAGDRPQIDPRVESAALTSAWKEVVAPGSPLAEAGVSRAYVAEEVRAVIKGRGLRSVDEYLAVERTGRRVPFGPALRQQVWRLHEAWGRLMQARGAADFADVVLRARDHARRRPQPTYRAAIVDEAQDLTLVGLQLVRALVNGPAGGDRPDGLFIVGDGAQRIYPGGFTLRQAGVEVRGRTSVLRLNYRNSRQIVEAARAVAGDETVVDLGETYARGDEPAEADRDGMRPVLVEAADVAGELDFVVEEVGRLVASGAIGPGDMAVSTATNELAQAARDALEAAGIGTQPLELYDGSPSPEVKIGTHFRIKGLEFKVVFLPGLGAGEFPPHLGGGHDAPERDEQRSLAVGRLYVAMTRARDGLFLTWSGEPSDVLDPVFDHVEQLDLRR